MAVVSVLLLLGAACGGDDDDSADASAGAGAGDASSTTGSVAGGNGVAEGADLEALEEEARAEGSFSCMMTTGEEIVTRVIEAFESEYPDIAANCERVSSGDQVERLTQELEADALSVDVSLHTDLLFARGLSEEGLLVDWNELPNTASTRDRFVEGFWDDYAPGIVGLANIFGYNTDNVSADELPTSWDDLLDPRWTGRMVGVDIDAGFGMVIQYDNLLTSQGEDFFTALGEQDVEMFATTTEAAQLVASGAKDITLLATGYTARQQQAAGAPFDVFTLPPATLNRLHAMVFADGPHPAAGRLFANWLLTDEGQCALACGAAFVSAFEIDGDTQELPEDFLMPDPEDVNAEADRVIELFEQAFR